MDERLPSILEYLIHFNSLAVHCLWGESALQYRFYKGLPACLKDEICKGDGKLNTLSELQKKAQIIDTWHWECVQERSQGQNLHPPNQQKTQSSSSNNTSNNTSKPAQSNSSNNSQSSSSKSGKSKETPKPQLTKPDLTGKLDSKGKLTQQEQQWCIDNNLCLFCGKPGHKVLDCPTKLASSAKGQASTTADELARALHPLTSYFAIYSTCRLHELHWSLVLTDSLLWQLIPFNSLWLSDSNALQIAHTRPELPEIFDFSF